MSTQWRARLAGLAFLVVSLGAHLLILVPRTAVLEIEPRAGRCHAGEAVRLTAWVRAGGRSSPARSPSWRIRSGRVHLLAPGVLRCDVEGPATVAVGVGNLTAEARIDVGPPIIDVDPSRLHKAPSAPEAPEPLPIRTRRRAPAARAAASREPAPDPAPAAARAAEILTAEPSAGAEPPETEDVVSEPGGDSAGSGIVAAGGQATVGAAGARRDGVLGGTGSGSAAPAMRDLSRPPAVSDRDPCRGYFPDDARADEAVVELDVDVAADGSVRRAAVLAEAPSEQGFGGAARRCFAAMRLEPALDRQGRPTSGRMTFRFRFAR